MDHALDELEKKVSELLKSIILKLLYLAEQVLPQSLSELTSRHDHISQVIQYLEGAYLSAEQSTEERTVVEERVWKCPDGCTVFESLYHWRRRKATLQMH